MRFVIIGAGGVGGTFGARLAAAGNEVAFVARGAHGAALAERGLTVRAPAGEYHLANPSVLTTPEEALEAGPADFLLLCVKMQDLAPLAARLGPVLAPETSVLPLQNGVEAEDILCEALGAGRVLGGVAYIFAHIAAPGVIEVTGKLERLAFGELDGSDSARQEVLLAACTAADIGAEASERIHDRIWRKFALLSPLAGATCLGRCPVGGVRDDPALAAKLTALVEETVALGRMLCGARGVALPEDLGARTLKAIGQLDGAMKTSMLSDLEAGKPLELAWLNGAVARLGAAAGLATPANDEVVAALTPLAQGR